VQAHHLHINALNSEQQLSRVLWLALDDIMYTATSCAHLALPPCCCTAAAAVLTPQEQRNILAIAVGLRGIAAIRAVLNWAPVQAHATSHKVSCYYVTKSPSSAAFLAEWDQWREAGVSDVM
jgi:hypothetical protein